MKSYCSMLTTTTCLVMDQLWQAVCYLVNFLLEVHKVNGAVQLPPLGKGLTKEGLSFL